MEIKEIIFNYLDKEYPIDGITITVDYLNIYTFRYVESIRQVRARTVDKWVDVLGEELINNSHINSNQVPDISEITTAVDRDIVAMFGVKLNTYFWEWTEDRIGETVTIQFTDHKITFHKRTRIWGNHPRNWGIKIPPPIGPIIDVP